MMQMVGAMVVLCISIEVDVHHNFSPPLVLFLDREEG